MELLPAIIVVTYNRPNALNRLLSFLDRANYPSANIPLVLSIDYGVSQNHTEVENIADNFVWKYGSKVVIKQKSNLGLRKHVIKCGDLTEKYDSIIMLEDDIIVSPYFYSYSVDALEFYLNEPAIAGVSLYTHVKNISNKLPFYIIGDDSDVYFLQIASSWGQAWTKEQWSLFRAWYDKEASITENDKMPDFIKSWPESSWLKYFIKYMVKTDKYFVYPKVSLSSNYGDSGTHNLQANADTQVPLKMRIYRKNNFIRIEEAINVYDSFFELISTSTKQLFPSVNKLDFVIDLYGLKDLSKYNEPYAISIKKLKNGTTPIKGFQINTKPMIMNLLEESNLDVKYNQIFLAKRDGFINENLIDTPSRIWFYYFGKIHFSVLVKSLLYKVVNKIKG